MEAYATQATANDVVQWLVSDHLGTPRMVADLSGSLAGIRRHDYLPFGEEVGAGVGGRTQQQGYVADNVRQGFTGYEKDGETGLNFAQARYHSPTQGRFTSVDPENAGVNLDDPQSWNGYTYTRNNPLLYTDPDGRSFKICDRQGNCEIVSDEDAKKYTFNPEYQKQSGYYTKGDGKIYDPQGNVTGTYENLGCDCWSERSQAIVRTTAEALQNPATAASAAMGTGITIWTRTKKLTPAENAYSHWKKHGKDFPWIKNGLKYVQETRKFINSPPPGSVIKFRSNGEKVVYHPGTNTIAIADKFGTPKTMFKPDPAKHGLPTNWDCFNAQ